MARWSFSGKVEFRFSAENATTEEIQSAFQHALSST
jgi:hypothetical protein